MVKPDPPSEPDEIWKPVYGYEDLYMVSSHGRVFGLGRENILKSFPNADGYPQVGISRNSQKRHRRIHSLVLEAFRGLCPKNYEARHLDNNKDNPRLTNLEWAPTSINVQDRVATGMYQTGRLTDDQVRFIRTVSLEHGKTNTLCKQLGISRTTFHVVRRKEAYKHVKD